MTDGNIPELQDLEPLDPGTPAAAEAATAAPAREDVALAMMRAGLPPPAFNPMCRDKASYKFLMCGVLMVLGCLMPFSADLDQAGYKTMSGAFFLFIGLGMVWTWWGAIHHNRSTGASLKWLLLCVIPLAAQAMNLIAYDAKLALQLAKDANAMPGMAHLVDADGVYNWGKLFADMATALGKSAEAPEAAGRVEIFWRCFGTGRVFVFLGALLAEFYFFAGVIGGAKQNKAQKQARMAQATERKRR